MERRNPMWAHAAAVGDNERELGTRRLTTAPAVTDHKAVLGALNQALAAAEAAYLDMTNQSMESRPELAVTGACLLVALLRDDDVYVMNLGDSRAARAIVAQRRDDHDDCVPETMRVEDIGVGLETETRPPGYGIIGLEALQEMQRIKREHPDDDQCIVNNRVKGRLKVTRTFGAGYLKQAKLNDGLLEMFHNEFIGDTPYISCTPSLCHHKLSTRDQFLVFSSDGLYQYLSNEEVVLHVENFMERFPDGDPSQGLIEELLCRAAKKAGLDFLELLDIPHGDQRKYHDDVTVMVISLEGGIWKSSGTYVLCSVDVLPLSVFSLIHCSADMIFMGSRRCARQERKAPKMAVKFGVGTLVKAEFFGWRSSLILISASAHRNDLELTLVYK